MIQPMARLGFLSGRNSKEPKIANTRRKSIQGIFAKRNQIDWVKQGEAKTLLQEVMSQSGISLLYYDDRILV